jgi:WD40 repeat protein
LARKIDIHEMQTQTRNEIHLLEGPTKAWIATLTFSPKLLAVAYRDNSVWVWDAKSGRLLKILVIPSTSADAPPVVAFSRKGKKLVAASDMFATVWDTEKWAILFSSPVSRRTITTIDMDSAGDQFLTVDDSGTLTIHAIGLQDEISRAEKRVTKKFSDKECSTLVGESKCNTFYDDNNFWKTEKPPSAATQAQR